MARITFGPMVSEARGAIGGTVFARDRHGAYARAKAKLINPKSTAQQLVRAMLRAQGKAWSNSLTDQQRQAWTDLALTLAHVNVVGAQSHLMGLCQFTQATLNLLHAALPTITAAPQTYSALDPGPITAAASSSAGTLSITPTNPLPSGYGYIVMATKPLRPGVTWFDKFLRQLRPGTASPLTDNFPGTSPTPPWVPNPYADGFFTNASNQLHIASGYGDSAITRGSNAWSAYKATFNLQLPSPTAYSIGPGWYTDPATGAGYVLILQPQASAFTWYYTSAWYYLGSTYIVLNATMPSDSNKHAWVIDATTTTTTISIDGTPVASASDTTRTQGAFAFYSGGQPQIADTFTMTGNLIVPETLNALGPAYLLKFGTLPAGSKIGLTLAYVNPASGCKSPTQSTLLTVAA
jgi:hypothetical protein